MNAFGDFKSRFKLLVSKQRHLVVNTLSNIFRMRLVGNKTHGDLAEIGIAEFINQFMYDFKSIHVGKDLFRAKDHEEDIVIKNEISGASFPVSLKAYGDGPLQLSTDRDQLMFPFLESMGKEIVGPDLAKVFSSQAFSSFNSINVMPLIYSEQNKKCNIMIFDHEKAIKNTARIIYVGKGERLSKTKSGKDRLHPIYAFLDSKGGYICEVRYGGASANALQRGLWTHTQNAIEYFDSLTNGWINFSHNKTLIKLIALALNSGEKSHAEANEILQKDIDELRKK
ncbi:MAG: hypothetical protein EBQ85_07145 [Proteobacteria bacterium]|nr:hypothetical protein [Pseudomonadota bacterium]